MRWSFPAGFRAPTCTTSSRAPGRFSIRRCSKVSDCLYSKDSPPACPPAARISNRWLPSPEPPPCSSTLATWMRWPRSCSAWWKTRRCEPDWRWKVHAGPPNSPGERRPKKRSPPWKRSSGRCKNRLLTRAAPIGATTVREWFRLLLLRLRKQPQVDRIRHRLIPRIVGVQMVARIERRLQLFRILRVPRRRLEIHDAVEFAARANPVVHRRPHLFPMIAIVTRPLVWRQRAPDHLDAVSVRPLD